MNHFPARINLHKVGSLSWDKSFKANVLLKDPGPSIG